MHREDEAGRWRVANEDIIHENQWFRIINSKVIYPDGVTGDYYHISHSQPAVGIVAEQDGKFLLLRQYRFTIDQFVWAIPSGGVEPNESLENAAYRELLEETGFKTHSLKSLGKYYPSYGVSNQRFELFHACNLVATEQTPDLAEVIGYKWFSRDDILKMLRKNEIIDGLSLVPLYNILLFSNTDAK